MKLNFITGEFQVEPLDIAKIIMDEFSKQEFCEIYPNFSTKKGFTKSLDLVLPNQGVYCIYKYHKPIYVGFSTNSIHNRISRFLSGARGTENESENHPASYKYARVYPNDFHDLSVKFCSFNAFTLPENITIEQVEKELIYNLRPVFNKQIYKTLFVESSTLKIK